MSPFKLSREDGGKKSSAITKPSSYCLHDVFLLLMLEPIALVIWNIPKYILYLNSYLTLSFLTSDFNKIIHYPYYRSWGLGRGGGGGICSRELWVKV